MGYLMLINIKHIPLAKKKGLLLFLLLIFLGVIVSCSLKATSVSPEGTWNYPGGGASPMSMVFHSGGKLTFVGGFNNYHPATWEFDKKTRNLQIKVSNYDKSPTHCSSLYTGEYSCLHYNPKADFFECILTSKTKILSFLGWNFFRK
jgi:hypothetical protein